VPTARAANRPRWRGRHGFFEIWFLVVFDPGAERALWLRWTTDAPGVGRPEAPRATVWAAVFAGRDGPPVLALKDVRPIAAYDGADGVSIGDAALGHGATRGRVVAGGHEIVWDLAFVPAARAARREPWLVRHLPAPTRVAHANDGIHCSGWMAVDGRRHHLTDAPSLQKHIWGTRRVEELLWIACPAAAVEATAIRLRERSPRLVIAWTGGRRERRWTAPGLGTRAHVETPELGRLRIRAVSATRSLTLDACADPRTLAGYVYRDPSGFDVHVAQSDVADLTVEHRARAHPLAAWGATDRRTFLRAAAVEFHQIAALPGVRYLGWDETS
jgi:hypothetical protein